MILIWLKTFCCHGNNRCIRNLADTRSLQNVDIPFLAECLYCFEVYHCLEMGEVFDLSLCGKYNLFLFGWQYLSHRNLQKFSRQKSIDQISITTQALQASSETVVCLQKKKSIFWCTFKLPCLSYMAISYYCF